MHASGTGGRVLTRLGKWRAHLVVVAVWLAMAAVLPTVAPDGAADDGWAAVGDAGEVAGAASTDTSLPQGGDELSTPEGAALTPTELESGTTSTSTAPSTGGAPASDAPPGTVVGSACGPGIPQYTGLSYAPPCVSPFEGDNGGATARGVTGDRIRVVARLLMPGGPVVGPIAAGAMGADVASVEAVAQEFVEWGNEVFELYGREVEFVLYRSRHGDWAQELQGRGRAGACQDAAVITDELKAFAVIGEPSIVFQQCAAERGLVVFGATGRPSEQALRAQHPYVWSLAQSCDRLVHHVLTYVGRRLDGRVARWAGDAAYRRTDRRFGIYVPDNEQYQGCVEEAMGTARERFGIDFVRFDYTPDPARLPDQAAQAVARFKSQGVTSLILTCDPYSVVFLTRSARQQRWYPEWITTGAGGEELAGFANQYDQQVVDGHMFGPTDNAPDAVFYGPESEPARLYRSRTGRALPAESGGPYWFIVHMNRLLQAAGPRLDAAAVAQGAARLPAADGPLGRWWFGESPDGRSGGGSHAEPTQSIEVFWQGGASHVANGGRWFSIGDWPASEPEIFGAAT